MKRTMRIIICALLTSPLCLVYAQQERPGREDTARKGSITSGQEMTRDILHRYLQQQNREMLEGSPEYQSFLTDILLGEYPELSKGKDSAAIVDYAHRLLRIPKDRDTVAIEAAPFTRDDINKDEMSLLQRTQQRTQRVGENPIWQMEAVSYNRAAAANYGLNWSLDGGQKRNPDYPDFTYFFEIFGNDCTNFVSQAVRAGGRQMEGTGDCKNENTYSEWYVKSGTPWWCQGMFSGWAWSNTWTVVSYFRQYMSDKNYALVRYYPIKGSDANKINSASLNQIIYDAWEGDVIQIRQNGSSTHSMLVTSWYWYSRDNSDLKMTYHSGPGNKDVVGKSLRTIASSQPANTDLILIGMYPR